METAVRTRPRNRLLCALSDDDYALVEPALKPVKLGFRRKLQSSNRRLEAVYFPESGLASVVAIAGGDRRQAEVGVIGREGMTGLAIVLGAIRSPCEIFMQVEGTGQCITFDDFRKLVDDSPSLKDCCLRYVHAFYIQAAHTALSNAHGTIEERLARWLLMAQDRLESRELVLTHEFLSLMLGVRRAGVSVALQHFEEKAMIGTARGSITVLDRDGLVEVANGLYGVPEAEYERLFDS